MTKQTQFPIQAQLPDFFDLREKFLQRDTDAVQAFNNSVYGNALEARIRFQEERLEDLGVVLCVLLRKLHLQEEENAQVQQDSKQDKASNSSAG